MFCVTIGVNEDYCMLQNIQVRKPPCWTQETRLRKLEFLPLTFFDQSKNMKTGNDVIKSESLSGLG